MWGAAVPLSIRLAWAVLGGGAPQSPESRLLTALVAFFGGVGFLLLVALARGELGVAGSRLQQVVSLLAAAATTATLVAVD